MSIHSTRAARRDLPLEGRRSSSQIVRVDLVSFSLELWFLI